MEFMWYEAGPDVARSTPKDTRGRGPRLSQTEGPDRTSNRFDCGPSDNKRKWLTLNRSPSMVLKLDFTLSFLFTLTKLSWMCPQPRSRSCWIGVSLTMSILLVASDRVTPSPLICSFCTLIIWVFSSRNKLKRALEFRGSIALSHLLFADDLILLGSKSVQNC